MRSVSYSCLMVEFDGLGGTRLLSFSRLRDVQRFLVETEMWAQRIYIQRGNSRQIMSR
jgi:hypothetical protein